MRKLTILTLLLACLAPAALQAQSVYSDTYVIPVVAHTPGAFGTTWMSDVVITNFHTTPLTVQLIVIESGENNSDNIFPLISTNAGTNLNGSVTVAPNNTLVLRDVLAGYNGRTSSSGALILGGDQTFAVTSRTYSISATGVSNGGQTVTPARDFFENATGRSDNNAVAYITGIANNASTRTNIGFVAGTGSGAGATLAVEVTIRSSTGASLGTKLVSIPAGNFTQTQFSVSSITNTPFDAGSAEFRILGGLGSVLPYASVIDNNSSNAMYIMGQFPASTALGKGAIDSNIFRSLFHR
jgi:hypothetical protein